MKIISSLNLSELMGFLESEEDVLNIIKKVLEKEKIPPFERIYLGSNFCSIYFTYLNIKYYKNILDFSMKYNLKVTLVIPIINEGLFDLALGRIKEILDYSNNIDEITVNDYGMLSFIQSAYPNIKINIGRLLNKDTRDVRFIEFTNMKMIPDNLTYDKFLLDETNVSGLEIDVTHQNIDLNNTKYNIGIHVPYLYQTYGHICEYASINLPGEKKFRPNHKCAIECKRTFILYSSDIANYLKYGRTLYTKIKMPNIYNKDTVRMIFFPVDYIERENHE